MLRAPKNSHGTVLLVSGLIAGCASLMPGKVHGQQSPTAQRVNADNELSAGVRACQEGQYAAGFGHFADSYRSWSSADTLYAMAYAQYKLGDFALAHRLLETARMQRLEAPTLDKLGLSLSELDAKIRDALGEVWIKVDLVPDRSELSPASERNLRRLDVPLTISVDGEELTETPRSAPKALVLSHDVDDKELAQLRTPQKHPEPVDGKLQFALQVNPGMHTLRIEQSGFAALGQQFIARRGRQELAISRGNSQGQLHIADIEFEAAGPKSRRVPSFVSYEPAPSGCTVPSRTLDLFLRGPDGKEDKLVVCPDTPMKPNDDYQLVAKSPGFDVFVARDLRVQPGNILQPRIRLRLLPIYKQAWFWPVLAGAAIVVGSAVGVPIYLSRDPRYDRGTGNWLAGQ